MSKKRSKQWYQEHVNDPFVRQAQKEGFLSRAAYKLQEIDQRYSLIQPSMQIVELGAAPGGWTQYIAQKMRGKGRIYAVDLLPMTAFENVEIIQGDFTEQKTLDLLLGKLEGQKIDLVLSDMAPNISGIKLTDQARGAYLMELSLDLATEVLRPGGNLLMKGFQGSDLKGIQDSIRERFRSLYNVKPKASRSRSSEIYLLAKDFQLV